MNHLALDGPLNGAYISEAQAEENNYGLDTWSSGEKVYIHSSSSHVNGDFDPDD